MERSPEAAGAEPQALADYPASLDGIDYAVVVSDEGFPIAFSNLNQEEAEAAAALAVDLLITGSETVRDLAGSEAREILVSLGEDTVINVSRARNLLLLLKGRRNPVEAALVAVRRAAEGQLLRCPHCSADLTLEPYTCPKCRRRIPYTADSCPHCGADVRFKKCPRCGGLLSTRGLPVEESITRQGLLMAVSEAILGAGMLGALSALADVGVLGSLVAAAAGGGVAGYIAFRLAPREYREASKAPRG